MSFIYRPQSIWDAIRLKRATFNHLNQGYYGSSLDTTKVRAEVEDLLYLETEEIIGVIFAYKHLSQPKNRGIDEDVYIGDEVGFSPLRNQPGNTLVSSALMDILHNMNISLLPVGPRRVKKRGRRQPAPSVILIFHFEYRSSSACDSTYHFVSYIYKNKRIYKLDGDQPNPVLIGSITDEDDDNPEWIASLVNYLADEIDDQDIEFSCAAIMKKPNYQEKLASTNIAIQGLEEKLKEYITTEEGHSILANIQRLRDECGEDLLTLHGVWHEPRLFPLRRGELDSDSERRVAFNFPSESGTSSSGSSTIEDDGSSTYVVIENDRTESASEHSSDGEESSDQNKPMSPMFSDVLYDSPESMVESPNATETEEPTDELYEEELIETQSGNESPEALIESPNAATETEKLTDTSYEEEEATEHKTTAEEEGEGTMATIMKEEEATSEVAEDIEEDEVRTSVKRKYDEDDAYKRLPPKKRFTRR
ncbi:hypothetical protein K501DRAFT_275396 [Backusella circina FSU 941]|nr:hypothetical protein K501DRAFT_275396 [Backusella circina FSU 941]